jgi:acetylornithine deacetylase/succinyl-diaminopimelate desuccinylase-like protein
MSGPVQAVADQVISRTIELSAVPAPPLHEQDRAAVVRGWWAADGLREHGISPRLTAASTDANAAYPLGIPALTLGITTGGGTHTEQEWIDIEPVPAGLAALATTIARLDEQEW